MRFGEGLPPAGGWKRDMEADSTEYSPEYQDEYRRLWHEAAAARDLLAAALREIANPQEWQRGHRAPFEVARAALAGVTDTRGE